jgi:hypothetical protein
MLDHRARIQAPSESPVHQHNPSATIRQLQRQRLQQRWAELLDQEARLRHWEGLTTCQNIRWSHGWWTWIHDQNVALLEQMAAVVDAHRELEER